MEPASSFIKKTLKKATFTEIRILKLYISIAYYYSLTYRQILYTQILHIYMPIEFHNEIYWSFSFVPLVMQKVQKHGEH